MSTKSATPTWILSDRWGVSRDRYNWTLYRKTTPDPSKPEPAQPRWWPLTYHSNPAQLFRHLVAHIEAEQPVDGDLLSHAHKCRDIALQMADTFDSELAKHGYEDPMVRSVDTPFPYSDKPVVLK